MQQQQQWSLTSRTVVLLFCSVFIGNIVRIKTDNVTIVSNVSDHILQRALNYLKKDSFNQHVYSSGSLITAEKWQEDSNIFYRLTVNLEPNCTEDFSCPRQICTIVMRKDENDIIEIDEESKDCKYVYPKLDSDEIEEPLPVKKIDDVQEQEIIRNLEKQIMKTDAKDQYENNGNTEESVSVKRNRHHPYYCAGCPYDLNPTAPGIESFRNLAEKSIDKTSQSSYKRRVIKVIRVTYQAPIGSNSVRYQTLMEIGLTNCLKTDDVNRSECLVKSSEPTNLCAITFEEKPTVADSRRVVQNNCTDLNDNLSISEPELIGESLTRSTDDDYQKESKTEFYDQIAQEGQINTFESSIDDLFRVTIPKEEPISQDEYAGPEVTETPFQQTVISNDNVEPERFNGFVDKIKEFDAFLEEQFDIPLQPRKEEETTHYGDPVVEETIKPERVEVKDANESNLDSNRRSKREALAGGVSEADINDENIMKYADLGVKNVSSAGGYQSGPITVLSATKQVVAGMLYKIKVHVGNSNCTKSQIVAAPCSCVEDDSIKIYEIEAWVRPWISKDPEITVKPVELCRQKRHLRGQNYSQKMLDVFNQQKQHEEAEYQSTKLKFQQFKKDYNKVYSSYEEEKRFKIFRKNLKTIEQLQEGEQGTAKYGPTMFADLSPEEFRSYLGYRKDLKIENNIPLRRAEIPDVELPREFDWRDSNVVTPVKNQGACGSCWAFSVTGNVEGQYAIKHKKLLSLSEQELVDCDDMDDGCNGGLQENAYKALEKLGGLELEKSYPYDARDEKCHFEKNKALVKVVDAVNITSNETQMAQWLVKNGPMAIAINANAMQFYMGGISHPFKFLCNPASLDHGVLIVGYGIHKYPLFKKELPYWIVKNSWGTGWGEKGYYRVYRGDGTCGVNADVSSAIVA